MNIKTKGFTLIELLVVICIVGILAGFAVVQMNGAINTANDAKKKTNLDSIKKALVMYGIENGEKYPSEDGCVIGSCPTLDAVLEPFLPTDTEGSFVYQSSEDGTSFTLSSVLSSGYSYEYDSSTGIYSTNTPINGICGTSNGSNLSSIPSTNLCNTGTAGTVNGSGPWTWSCAGTDGGTTASCATGSVPTNGSCGSAHGSSYYSTPSSNLCTNGTPSSVSGSGPWTWTCNGTFGGLSPACAANISLDGTCGSSHGANLSTIPSTNLCNYGTAGTVSGSGPWDWTCTGTNGGTTASCSTGILPVNGACGSSNGSNFSSTPSSNLCTLGSPTTVSGSGPWTWDCTGLNSGSTDSCSANLIVNGTCGTANKTYAYNITTYGSDTYCAAGTTNPTTPTFPALGGSTNWTCVGLNTGTTASCTASRNNTPVNGVCGTSNGSNFYSIPSSNLCTAGTPSSVGGSGPWTWTCNGLYGGTTANCSANLSVNGVCGSKNNKYATSTPAGTQACTAGSIIGMTGSYSWSCAGQNGGTSPSCATVAATYGTTSFTTVGTTSWTVPAEVTSVQYLVVGGGGSGGSGSSPGGGGGAGGFLTATGFTVSPGASITVTVGSGGAAVPRDTYRPGNNGGNSVFGTITAVGGGGGGTCGASRGNGSAGGSGGGAANDGEGHIYGGDADYLSPRQGYDGGNGYNYYPAGGGGGAGGVGGTPTSNSPSGNGGVGLSSSITGSAIMYAGGGGGGNYNGTGGSGGSGGGGAGSVDISATAGTDGLGGGGGGIGSTGYSTSYFSGKGGSGIVIIKYINNY
jgi:prepilin-type N-terminal cleavage/methylation domain-containing protein